MTQTIYYARLDDEVFGPFALETLAGMSLTPDILVHSSETDEWRQACEYPELASSLDYTLYSGGAAPRETVISGIPNCVDRTPLPPEFNARSVFYIRRGHTPYGPYSLEALSAAAPPEDAYVSVDDMVSWWHIYDIPGLAHTLDAINAIGARPTPEPIPEQEPGPASDPVRPVSMEGISCMLERVQELVPRKKTLFQRVFPSKDAERDFLIDEYKHTFSTLLGHVRRLAEDCSSAGLARRALSLVATTVNGVAGKINGYYLSEIEKLEEDSKTFTASSVSIGQTHYSLLPPLDEVRLVRLDFLSALGEKNLLVTFDEVSETRAADFVNNIVGRLYEKNPPRSIVTYVVDTDFMTGLDDSFKLLNRDLYRVISRQEEVRETLASLQLRASSILRNLLVEKGSTLREYNNTHESKEANVLLVLRNFPRGLTAENLANLRRLAKVGPKVGIYVILLTPEQYLASMPGKDAEAFDLAEFTESANAYEFRADDRDFLGALTGSSGADVFETCVMFDTLSETDLRKIVHAVNDRCEMREEVVVSIADHLPDRALWWRGESARQIEIPFGVGGDMLAKSLRITQESGQNTAVVIGIPGSGKSVFLHTLICSAAMRYSPDELRMYLIDFSGVEFNSYAVGKLPHARVIAPEAEREFGLSILNELVEEGSRRMTLCREHNVSNIVDLKRAAPGINVPRLLVVIDEFQKLFEIENDAIAKEANSKIHIIIQEFRKFGINLILATQKLPSSSFLPRDLIANRIVFKSAPNDFDTLISSESRGGMPRLRTGQCVYNSESGAAYASETVQGFFTSRADIDAILERLCDFGRSVSYTREPLKVFRSGDLPDFGKRRMAGHHDRQSPIPFVVPLYVGESIAVSDTDVFIELAKENANNILVIGGEPDVARGIAFNAMRSAVAAHTPDTARVFLISGMRPDNPLNAVVSDFAASAPCEFAAPTGAAGVEGILKELREEIELRRSDPEVPQQHVYVLCLDFQSIRAFDKDFSGMMPKLSAAAKDMEAIIRNGPAVGVFVIAQTDTLDALNRVSQSSALPMFNFRVALQMPEDISYKVIGTPQANRLFVFNRPASVFRAYLRDNVRNQTTKFKPYK